MGVSLTRTQGTPTSRKKFTFSFWYKKTTVRDYGASTSDGLIFNSADSNDNRLSFYINQENSPYDTVRLIGRNGASQVLDVKTNAVLRDPSAWYHIVAKVDTTQSTNTDRAKLYINGVEQSLSISTYPNQDVELNIQYTPYLLSYSGSGNYVEGLITHYHYTDGYAYDASTFGETDSTSGIWKPKTAPSVTYGTNGFFLKFENSGAMGTDSSGNGNNFTVSGTLTQNVDTPSNNFSTLTPLVSRKGTLTNGNLTHEGSGATAPNNVISSLGVTSGKFYIEAKLITGSNYNGFGVVTEKNSYINSGTNYLSNANNALMYVYSDIYRGGASISGTYATLATNDIVRIAIDADNKFLYFGVNDTWQNSSDPTSGSSGTGALNMTTYLGSDVTYFVAAETGGASNTRKIEFNFGQGYFGTTAVVSANADGNGLGAFEYAVPSGYYALCTKNIKEFG